MEDYNQEFNKSFFKTLENSIQKLPQSAREELYRPCAQNCVKNYVLAEQRRLFDECGGDLDAQYKKYGRSDYFYADIIESGHIYDMGYPRCLCPVAQTGLASSSTHCECSRQSIMFVLNTLMPNKHISVELMHTVLSGASECRFRVIVE